MIGNGDYELHTLDGRVYRAKADDCHLRGSDGSAAFLRTENAITSLQSGARYEILPDGRVIGENGVQLGFLQAAAVQGKSRTTSGTAGNSPAGASPNGTKSGSTAGSTGTPSSGSTKSGKTGNKGCLWVLLIAAAVIFFVVRHSGSSSSDTGSSGSDTGTPGFTIAPTSTPAPTAAPRYEDVLGGGEWFDDEFYPDKKPDWADNLYTALPEGTVYLDASAGESDLFHNQISLAIRRKAPAMCFRDYRIYSGAEFYDIGYASYGAFWVESFGVQKHSYQDSDGKIHTIDVCWMNYYDLTNEQIRSMVNQIIAEANSIIELIPAYADDWTAAKIIHDELCRRVTFDLSVSAPHVFDLYGALVNHNAVCSAYTSAFAFLMYCAGYWGEGVYSEEHAWNCLYVPSPECFVDSTWDDLNITDRYGRPYIRYDFFFLTAEEVARVDAHTQIGHGASFGSTEGNLPYNYFKHEGYMLDSCDKRALTDAFRRQLATGTNYLTVRFTNWEDYQKAISMTGDGSMSNVVSSAGYRDSWSYLYNDDLLIFSVLLYPAE